MGAPVLRKQLRRVLPDRKERQQRHQHLSAMITRAHHADAIGKADGSARDSSTSQAGRPRAGGEKKPGRASGPNDDSGRSSEARRDSKGGAKWKAKQTGMGRRTRGWCPLTGLEMFAGEEGCAEAMRQTTFPSDICRLPNDLTEQIKGTAATLGSDGVGKSRETLRPS